jgi:multidrug efflux system membrane fusion protein
LGVNVNNVRLQVPVNALLFRSEGLRAAVVDANHKVHLRALVIGRDYGTSLEVLQGLEPGDWIIVNPADSIDEGQAVNVKETAQAPVAGAPNGTSGSGKNPQSAPPGGKKQ